MDVLLWSLVGYVVGSLPSAYLAAVLTGHADLTKAMLRTAGESDAHIVLRDGGAGRAATAAAVTDVVKAFVPVIILAKAVGPYQASACGVGAVAGHCWPPYFRASAGRGLSAAAGMYIALTPVEMFLGGIVTVVGIWTKVGGIASTVGFVAVPLFAAYRRQPSPYVFAELVAVALIVVRRLEGVSQDVASGVPPGRAVLRRALFDVSRQRDQ
jgi:glycerol-3-phosphate acyltransferase PlsY